MRGEEKCEASAAACRYRGDGRPGGGAGPRLRAALIRAPQRRWTPRAARFLLAVISRSWNCAEFLRAKSCSSPPLHHHPHRLRSLPAAKVGGGRLGGRAVMEGTGDPRVGGSGRAARPGGSQHGRNPAGGIAAAFSFLCFFFFPFFLHFFCFFPPLFF